MTTNVATPVIFALGTLTTAFSFVVIEAFPTGVWLLGRRRARRGSDAGRAWSEADGGRDHQPNSTEAMTEAMVNAARAAAPGREFAGGTSHPGPPAIRGAEDGAATTPPLLDLVSRADREGAEAIIVGCFDDSGLGEAARRTGRPVVGLGQAAYHLCVLPQWRFSALTTLAVSR